jgi:hypothetical protein
LAQPAQISPSKVRTIPLSIGQQYHENLHADGALIGFLMLLVISQARAPCAKASPLIRADAHRRFHRMIADEQLGQRQGVALGPVGDIDAADLVAQMPRLRDQIP